MDIGVAQKWYAGAAVASIGVLAGGYFLLVSPQQSNASDIATQTQVVASSNVATEAQIATLKAQYADLPSLQSQVAVIRNRLPQTPNEPTLLRSLSALATSSGVVLTTVQAQTPTPMVAGVTSGTATSALGAPGQVSQLPLSITVTGTFTNTRLFLNGLESMPRAMLVTGLDISRDSSTATVNNISTVVTARVFMANPGYTAPASTANASVAGSTTTQPS
jgi:Tfp pilus assembly protein PilO